jgi:GR25 family glycosyltransferase involved in LPS biosynthesis
MQCPIFVISLPTATARQAAIAKQLDALGATYEFVPGIFGTDEQVMRRYDEALTTKERKKPMLIGERGCALAHALVHERIVREEIPVALILEDDIVFSLDFMTVLTAEVNRPDRNWDWLLFDYRYIGWSYLRDWLRATRQTIQARPSFFWYALLKSFYIFPLTLVEGVRDALARRFPYWRGPGRFMRPLFNAGAYLLTLEGAKKLAPLTTPLRFTADELPNIARRRVGLRYFGYVPLIVKQNIVDFETDAGKTNEVWEGILSELGKK